MTSVNIAYKVEDLIDKRIIGFSDKSKFPKYLRKNHINWITIENSSYISVIFFSDRYAELLDRFKSKKQDLFPNLITTSFDQAAIHITDGSRFNIIKDYKVEDIFSFSVGQDTSFIVLDHTQCINSTNLGIFNYEIPLGYIVSYGNEINPNNVLGHLDQLITCSIKYWENIGIKQ